MNWDINSSKPILEYLRVLIEAVHDSSGSRPPHKLTLEAQRKNVNTVMTEVCVLVDTPDVNPEDVRARCVHAVRVLAMLHDHFNYDKVRRK